MTAAGAMPTAVPRKGIMSERLAVVALMVYAPCCGAHHSIGASENWRQNYFAPFLPPFLADLLFLPPFLAALPPFLPALPALPDGSCR